MSSSPLTSLLPSHHTARSSAFSVGLGCLFLLLSLSFGCDDKEKLKRVRIPLPPHGITSEMMAPSSGTSASPPAPSEAAPAEARPSAPAEARPSTPTPSAYPMPPPSSASPLVDETLAGVRWQIPHGWSKASGPRGMRFATYQIPGRLPSPSDKTSGPGECSVFYFGSQQGGDIQANLRRWIAQFVPPPGKTSADIAQTSRQTFGRFAVTTLEVLGTFLFSPRPMDPKTIPIPDQRLLGAIVEAPQGHVFFKCVGPSSTLLSARPAFLSLLRSLR